MANQVSLTWEEWEQKFKPIKNTIRDNWDSYMFETYGEEVEFVHRYVEDRKVWTWLDFGNGSVTINGYSIINRLGYYITEVPYDEDTDYEIALYLETCEQCGEVLEDVCIEDDGELTCTNCCGHERCK